MADVMEREAVDLPENNRSSGARRPYKRQRFSDDHNEVDHINGKTTSVVSATSDAMETSPQKDNKVGSTTQNDRTGGSDDDVLEKEIRAGIKAFVHSNSPGFCGVLKQRYTDFLVNEILPNGQVLHLTNLVPPKRKQLTLDPLSQPFVPPSSTAPPTTIKQPLSASLPTTISPPTLTSPPTNCDPPTSTSLSPLSISFIPATNDSQRAERLTLWQNLPGELARADAESRERSEREHEARLANPPPDFHPTYTETFRETKPGKRLGQRQVVSVTTITHNPPTAEESFTESVEDSHTQPQKPQVGPIDSAVNHYPGPILTAPDILSESTRSHESAASGIKSVPHLEGSDMAAADHHRNTNHAGHENSISNSDASSEQERSKATNTAASITGQTIAIMNADEEVDDVERASGNITVAVDEKDVDTLQRIFGSQITTEILSLYRAVIQKAEKKAREFRPVVTGAIEDRQVRTEAHQAIRRIFKSRLDTATSESGSTINSIKIQPTPSVVSGRGGSAGESATRNRSIVTSNSAPRGRSAMLGWTALGGEYLHFTLYKENKDTMESVGFLARQLKVAPKSFQFSGTKDRRAVTVQRVSCYRIHADQLFDMGKRLRSASVGDFVYQKEGLELGDLAGNEFVITLRDCRFPGEDNVTDEQRLKLAATVVGERVNVFKHDGFLNYFGLQRFGSFHATTDSIGTKLLQGNVKGAIEDILEFSPECLAAAKGDMTDRLLSRDDVARAEGIDIWNTTQNSHKALDKIPRKFSAETSIIRFLGLRQQGTLAKLKDYQGAMMMLPRNLRLMYVHAYQSLVWNVVAGRRWEMYGNIVVEGDLVIVHEHKDKVALQIDEADVDETGEAIVRPAAGDRAADTEDAYTRARALTKEEVESGQYNITDVVLPLPGFDVIYPPNAVKECYETFMASERGGGLDPHNMRRAWKDMSLSGGYRKLIGRPGPDIGYEIRSYTDDNEQLVETDLERLQEQNRSSGTNPVLTEEAVTEVDRICGDSEPISGEEIPDTTGESAEAFSAQSLPPKIAVVLKMQLAPSQYATMALRELLGASGIKTYKPDYGGGR